MQEKSGPSRRGKLPSATAPTISSLNRARSPAATPVSCSPPPTFKRTLSTHRQSQPSSQQGSPSNGRPLLSKHNSKLPFSESSAVTARLHNVIAGPGSRAHLSNSDKLSLLQASLDHSSMASSEGGSALRLPKSQSEKPKQPAVSSKRASNATKSVETQQRRRSISLSQPKKGIKETSPASASRRASQSSNEVKQGRERSLSRAQLVNGQAVNKVRREKFGLRGRRRGYHIADLPSRRRALTYRGHPSKMDGQGRRHSLDDPANNFPLLSLEDYLQQRGPSARDAMQTVEDMESPTHSRLACMQKPNLRKNGRLVLVGEPPPQFVDVSLNDERLLAKFSVHTYLSADEADDVIGRVNSDRSGRGMSLHWPSNNRTMSKNENLLHYAGSCFNVSRRRLGGRKNRVTYMYNSERSMSSYDSDTEMAPLMTEPEPFHEFSDDESASSVEEQQGHLLGELTYNGYKDIHSHGGERMFLEYKDAHSCEATSLMQGLLIRRPNDMAGKHRSISQKYRPKSFKDVLGQKMVAESLSNAILRSKIAPVYLFHGPRGTGKTTVAKIFTCAMNCLSIEELRPCGLCKECSSFNAGTNYDVKEVDAAGNNELESMKHVLKHLSLPPSVSRYKVFIMDDCHMLTPDAWNALLKSLEEPPEYVVFILITTDSEQLPRAAISRCQKFMFNRIKDADIVFRLRKLAQQEKVDIEGDALQFIAAQSDGSLRDAETMLDQLSLLGKRVTLAIVREMVGLIPEEELINLLEMVLSADTMNTVSRIRELMGSGVEPLALTSQLATLITDILAGRCQIARYSGMRVKKDQQDKLQEALKILSDLEKQLRSCSDRTTWVTAAFLQLASNSSHPSSSRGTSVPQSPGVFPDVSEKEISNLDGTGRRYSWAGKEKWDAHAPLQRDGVQGHPLCENFSGTYMDNRIYPCDQSPQSGASTDEKAVCRFPDGTLQDGHNDKCSTLSPCSMDDIWQKVLHGNSSSTLKQLLEGEGKLLSLSIAEGFAIARLEFKSLEHKSMAERAIQSISNAFQVALLCPVKIEISLLLPSQGRGGLACRRDDHSVQINSEHHCKRTLLVHELGYRREQGPKGISFRKSSTSSSFRNAEFPSSSPKCHELEYRKSMQGMDGDVRAYSKRNADMSARDLQMYKGHVEPVSNAIYQEANGSGYVSEHQKSKDQRVSFDDLRFSGSLRWSDTREDMEYSSDSEIDGRYAPGLLCWKGTRLKDDRGKHHVLRRRRARFLLKLVPCAAKEEEDLR